MKKLNADQLDRMEGLVNQIDLRRFRLSVESISYELDNEGFENWEIKAYLQLFLDEYLGE
jgi:hypothetical protein